MEAIESCPLLANLEQLHTTKLGIMRIRRNLLLETQDVIAWCREQICRPDALIQRQGKNWYIRVGGCVITVNARSYTVITAHQKQN